MTLLSASEFSRKRGRPLTAHDHALLWAVEILTGSIWQPTAVFHTCDKAKWEKSKRAKENPEVKYRVQRYCRESNAPAKPFNGY